MRPAFTSSRNCEYSIGACAAWRVLNWLNTVISTSPMTSQMTRFLSMLFKDLLLVLQRATKPSYPRSKCRATNLFLLGRSRGKQAAREQVGFTRFTARSRRLEHFDARERMLEHLSCLLERFSVIGLGDERAVGLQRQVANPDRRLQQLEAARLIDVADSRDVGRKVRQHDVV